MRNPLLPSTLLLPLFACAPPSTGVSPLDETMGGSTTTHGEGELSSSAESANTSAADESDASEDSGDPPKSSRRVPAEWEPQAAVWMQWPQQWEEHFEPAFVEIIRAARQHQAVELVANDEAIARRGAGLLAAGGVPADGIRWHIVPNDNAWMRDNGPRYVQVDGQWVLQDWGFDAWGGNFGPGIPFAADDAVPPIIAEILDLPLETVDMVHERGDLEFNGVDTVMVNWSVVHDRNPALSEADATTIFREALGVESVIYLEGFHPEDGTTGHVDGLARFISGTQVVVGQVQDPRQDPVLAALFEDVAEQIAEQRPDLEIIRMLFPAHTDYMNWLVGNGYVIAGGFGDPTADARAQADIEGWFPDRTVYMVDVQALWADGGGVHCVTNDQPLLR